MSLFRLSIPQFLARENPKNAYFAKISFDCKNVRTVALNSLVHNAKFINGDTISGAGEREMAEYGPEMFVPIRKINGIIALIPLLYLRIPVALPANAGTARHGIIIC